MNNNDLTEFNEGKSHSENPLGGIPQGMNSNGQLNTVEENETKKGNFVYSDRLYINEDLVKQMNLPNYIKGKSFASASKAINDKFKDRNDIHTKATQKELLDRLAQSQEQLKAEQEAINKSMQVNQAEMKYPEETTQFEGGGFMDFIGNNGSSIGNMGSQLGSMINPNGYNGEDITKAANAGYENKHLQNADKYTQGLDMVQGQIAKSFGPVGEAVFGAKKLGENIGGAIGGDAGAAVKSLFSPEKSAIANLTDKNMKFGDKILGSLPIISGLKAKNSADKKLQTFKDTQNRVNNFYKYQFNENNDDTKTFALGGEIGTDPPIKKSITVDNTQNVQNKINETLGVTDPNGKVGHSRLMGEIKLINKRNDGYGILYDTDEGEKYEVVKSNAFTGMQDLPELKRYRYKRGEYSDPNFLEDGRNVEALKRGWQSSGYNPNLVAYPQSVESYRAAIGKPAFYTPEQLTSTSKQFKDGGFLNDKKQPWNLPQSTMYDDPGYINPLFDKKAKIPEVNYTKDTTDYNTMNYKSPISDLYGKYDNSNNFPNGIYSAPEKDNDSNDKKSFDFKQISDKFGNALRYAPVLNNMIQKNKIGPAEVDQAIKNPYQYKKQYIDESMYSNAAKEASSNTMEALNKSGLSGNQLMAASLGSQLQRTKGVAEGAMTAKMNNINEDKIAEQVKQQNMGDYIADSRVVREANAQNRANRDTQMSKFDAEIANSLGAIGKEETFKKMAEKITGYDWMGKYLKDNPNATPSEAKEAHDKEKESKKETTTYKKGGMMNLKFNKY